MALPSGTNFPGAIDGVSNGYGAVIPGQTIDASYANDQTSAILAVETAIGANPFTGTAFSTIGGGLAGLVAAMPNFGTDIGAANAYQVDLSPAPSAYAAGQLVAFKAAHTNTGASTMAFNSLSTKNLVKTGGGALQAGDIQSGQLVVAFYDGTQFQMLGVLAPSDAAKIGSVQTEAYTYAADSGAANAYAVSLSPTPPSYTAGQMVVFKAAHTNTGASTLNVNSQGTRNLVANGGAALTAGQIAAGQIVAAVYDGTQFQMVGSAGGSGLALPNTTNEYRLTLVSGTPVVSDNSSGGSTTIYLTPYTGSRIALYNSVISNWQIYTPGEVSYDASSLSDGVYDLFLQLVSGTPTLVSQAWTDDNDRATDLVLQDGVYVLSGDDTQRWVGTFFLDGGDCYDYSGERGLFNADHRLPRCVVVTGDTASTNTSWNALLSITMVFGILAESALAWGSALGAGDGVSTACEITTTFGGAEPSVRAATIGTSYLSSAFAALPDQIGVQTLSLYFQSSVSGNTVNLLDDGSGNNLTNLTGIVWC